MITGWDCMVSTLGVLKHLFLLIPLPKEYLQMEHIGT